MFHTLTIMQYADSTFKALQTKKCQRKSMQENLWILFLYRKGTLRHTLGTKESMTHCNFCINTLESTARYFDIYEPVSYMCLIVD